MATMTTILETRINVLATLNLHVTQMSPTKFQFNPTYRFEGVMSFEEFQDGCHGMDEGQQDIQEADRPGVHSCM